MWISIAAGILLLTSDELWFQSKISPDIPPVRCFPLLISRSFLEVSIYIIYRYIYIKSSNQTYPGPVPAPYQPLPCQQEQRRINNFLPIAGAWWHFELKCILQFDIVEISGQPNGCFHQFFQWSSIFEAFTLPYVAVLVSGSSKVIHGCLNIKFHWDIPLSDRCDGCCMTKSFNDLRQLCLV